MADEDSYRNYSVDLEEWFKRLLTLIDMDYSATMIIELRRIYKVICEIRHGICPRRGMP